MMAVVYNKDLNFKARKRGFDYEGFDYNHHLQPKKPRTETAPEFAYSKHKRSRDDFEVGMDLSPDRTKRMREGSFPPFGMQQNTPAFNSSPNATMIPSQALIKWQGQQGYTGQSAPVSMQLSESQLSYQQHSLPMLHGGEGSPGFRRQNMRDYTPAPATTQLVIWRDPNNYFQRDEGRYEPYPP